MPKIDKEQNATDEFSIEESLKKIESILEELKDENTTLKDSFALYEEGIKEVKLCSEEVDKLEKSIIVLSEN